MRCCSFDFGSPECAEHSSQFSSSRLELEIYNAGTFSVLHFLARVPAYFKIEVKSQSMSAMITFPQHPLTPLPIIDVFMQSCLSSNKTLRVKFAV